jgi:hypothetical protein
MKNEYMTPEVEMLPIDDVLTSSPILDDDEMPPAPPDWG